MKIKTALLRLLIPCMTALPPIHAASLVSPVRVEVRVIGGVKFDPIRGSSIPTSTQHKALAILLTGTGPATPAGLTAKWSIFGRDVHDGQVKLIHSGESPVTAHGGHPQIIETPEVDTSFAPDHFVVSGHAGGRGRRPSVKRSKAKA